MSVQIEDDHVYRFLIFKYSHAHIFSSKMNLQQQDQFYQMMTRLKANSRAASVPKENAIVTEIVDGLIVSKPAKKIEYLSTKETQASEPIVIDLQKSKAGSVPGINKLKEIHNFIRSNGRF